MERIFIFVGGLAALLIAERFVPRRRPALPVSQRWPGAFLLLGLGVVLGRLLVPIGLVGLAVWAQANNLGLFNIIDLSPNVAGLVAVVALDFAVWAQHVLMHHVSWLWRFHRVHHADPDFDVTTALRFHPGEIVLSLLWKGGAVILLGAAPYAVLIFEIVLNAAAMFNHSNMRLPQTLDRILRLFIVTPDMHRVHHSVDPRETNTNYGFFLPWWDHLFGVYTAQPRQGHEAMTIGLETWRSGQDQSPIALLKQPFESRQDAISGPPTCP